MLCVVMPPPPSAPFLPCLARSVAELFKEGEALERRRSVASVGSHGAAPPAALSAPKPYWQSKMKPGEVVVHSGLVEKKVGLFSRKRQLLLTSTPRLLYFNPSTQELRGETERARVELCKLPTERERPCLTHSQVKSHGAPQFML